MENSNGINGTIGNDRTIGTVKNGGNASVTEKTTLGELIAIIGDVEKAGKIPSPKVLRETGGELLIETDDIKVYSNDYAVYDNGYGRTVVWLPSCVSFTYHFNPLKDSEKGGDIKETAELPEGLLESQPWVIAVTLIGEHRIETNSMNRKSSRKGTKDYDSDDNGDKDGDAEDAVEESYRREYTWVGGRYGEDPLQYILRKEQQDEMLKAMTDKQREVFVLYYRDGYTQREIAEMLGISRDSVNNRLEGAMKKNKKIFS